MFTNPNSDFTILTSDIKSACLLNYYIDALIYVSNLILEFKSYDRRGGGESTKYSFHLGGGAKLPKLSLLNAPDYNIEKKLVLFYPPDSLRMRSTRRTWSWWRGRRSRRSTWVFWICSTENVSPSQISFRIEQQSDFKSLFCFINFYKCLSFDNFEERSEILSSDVLDK